MRGGVCPDPNSPDADDTECSKYFEAETNKEKQKKQELYLKKSIEKQQKKKMLEEQLQKQKTNKR